VNTPRSGTRPSRSTLRPAPPPIEATLSRIDYDLKVDGDLASGEVRLTVDVIKDGWVRLALPDGLMVREANSTVARSRCLLVQTKKDPAALTAVVENRDASS